MCDCVIFTLICIYMYKSVNHLAIKVVKGVKIAQSHIAVFHAISHKRCAVACGVGRARDLEKAYYFRGIIDQTIT